jgi:hypothetical protein
MTVEEIAKSGDWKISGDIGDCDVERCLEEPTKYAEVRSQKGNITVVDTWFFCGKHFAEYLRACDNLREKARQEASQPAAAEEERETA